MKIIIWAALVAAAIASYQANARDIAVASNNADGLIVLTDNKDRNCKGEREHSFYATNADVSMGVKGCYIVDGEQILLKGMFIMHNGQVSAIEQYNAVPAADFEIIPQ